MDMIFELLFKALERVSDVQFYNFLIILLFCLILIYIFFKHSIKVIKYFIDFFIKLYLDKKEGTNHDNLNDWQSISIVITVNTKKY